MKKKNFDVKKMAVVGVLGGISVALGLTPLGFIPVGPTKATIMHIPVIIGAIMEGPVVGGLVGLIFGLFSILQAFMNPTPVSFMLYNPLISVLPRVLIGIVSYYVYILFKKMGQKASRMTLYTIWVATLVYLVQASVKSLNSDISMWIKLFNILLIILTIFVGYYSHKKLKGNAVELVVSAATGTLTNTVGVLSGMYFIYGEEYALKLGLDPATAGKVILGIGITNGIPEIIIAMIIVTSVVASLKKSV
ncbi:ECF transporter S component [Anaerosalibacter sp. Marseille-P3206]|uniref:ECF transporter S component n=1 Tax=Anaerosalibacter sp. Marseille-P3206 TaxID=1871005 RepID=UPI000984D680|nr:ECF transporter S component [Anaerosalibacter sp. Marseille-P3206]